MAPEGVFAATLKKTVRPETSEPAAHQTKAIRHPAIGAMKPDSAKESAAPMPKNEV